MDCVRLSDAELLALVQQGGELYFPALHELEQRHFRAVRTFAAAGTVRPAAADELAYQSWQAALRQHANGSVSGALRPCALSSVLSTASVWARGQERSVLNRELAAWIETNGPVMLGNTATAGFRRPSLVARAFAVLPCRSQTVLWHGAVERDDSGLTGRLISMGPGDVSVLTGHAQSELHNAYVHLLRNGMDHECRLFHHLVLAYADARSLDIAMDLAPHLERCPRCSQAVADLGRVRHDCGALVAQALLPWGGLEHAARAANEGFTQETVMSGSGVPGPHTPGVPCPDAPGVPGWDIPAVPGWDMPGVPGSEMPAMPSLPGMGPPAGLPPARLPAAALPAGGRPSG
ncbi:hypothetical protein AN219_22935, partial [Streptomyces nanshensis]